MNRLFAEIDLSHARRVITVGDIHGHFSLLTDALERVQYDAGAGDQLILLGDLLDRGPDVMEIYQWLLANPEVLRVRGNHDDMLIAVCGLKPLDDYANPLTLIRNGGRWLLDYSRFEDAGDLVADVIESTDERDMVQGADKMFDAKIIDLARILFDAPIAIRAKTPGGHMVGFVHAEVPTRDWPKFEAKLIEGSRRVAREAMWTRDRFDKVRAWMQQGGYGDMDCSVPGIDHVFMGHSITKTPFTCGNCTWIDTGSYKHGLITAIDVDEIVRNPFPLFNEEIA